MKRSWNDHYFTFIDYVASGDLNKTVEFSSILCEKDGNLSLDNLSFAIRIANGYQQFHISRYLKMLQNPKTSKLAKLLYGKSVE